VLVYVGACVVGGFVVVVVLSMPQLFLPRITIVAPFKAHGHPTHEPWLNALYTAHTTEITYEDKMKNLTKKKNTS
jgi:hypothetical protein